jgi:nicotinamidase/pyrazinamidase
MSLYARPILVDVDTQLDFMHATGALAVPGAWAVIPQLQALVAAARKAGVRHLATLDTHTPDDPEFAAYGFPAHCVAGTPGWAKIPATAQADGRLMGAAPDPLTAPREMAFTKATFDVFTNPAFQATVAALQPTAAIVAGVATDYCVKAAVLGLRARGVPVLLVEDAIAAVAPETGAAALAEMVAAGAVLVRTADVVAALAAREAAHVA